MALVFKDRVKESTTSPGLATVTLAGAATGYQSFAAIGNGNTTYYCIADQGGGANWEVGIGTYTSAGTTLSRDTVLASSASGAKVNFSTGSQDVFCTYSASKAVISDASDIAYAQQLAAANGFSLHSTTINTSFTFPTGYNAISANAVSIAPGVTVTVPPGSVWLIVV